MKKPLLFILGLAQAGHRTSRLTMTNISFSSRRAVATHEHINSAPPATCLQLAGRCGALR
jgi:hypothetical protein